jgi:FkbM family methyltransferase
MTSLRARVLDALRRIGARPRLAPLVAVYLGAPTVRPSIRFAVRELLHREDLAIYRLRENGRSVAIRHGAAAVWVLAEVFNRRCYEPSSEVEKSLGEPTAIVDLGGNIGLFGLFAAARWPHARIAAFEPDRENAAIHELTINANGLERRWQLITAAASNRDGRVSFVSGLNAVSHIADSDSDERTTEVPVMDVLPRIAKADLLKMDIEGGEWPILGDPRFRESPPRAVVLEYHSHGCPGSNPRAEAERALEAAGMRVQSTTDNRDGTGLLWAWRT